MNRKKAALFGILILASLFVMSANAPKARCVNCVGKCITTADCLSDCACVGRAAFRRCVVDR